jgi:PTH1 family peptidyl-tRNA hydrolase
VGEIKLSHARNSGGHNGVESVIQKLNTKDFYRIRVGIGSKPIKEMLLQDYVLSKLSELEIELFTFKNKNKTEEGGIDLEKKFTVKLEEIKSLVK